MVKSLLVGLHSLRGYSYPAESFGFGVECRVIGTDKKQALERYLGQVTYLHGAQSLIQKRIVVTIEITIYLQILN